MLRMRYILPALACALGLCVGCTSTCDRPSWWSRLFDRHEPNCCKEGCCDEGCCPGDCCNGSSMRPTLIYDGPVLPEGAAPMMTPVPGVPPLPSPTPTLAPATNGRLVPVPGPGPQAQSQPIPYVPAR